MLRPPAKPTTSAVCSTPPSSSSTSHSSPSRASRPLTRISVPTTSVTLPVRPTIVAEASSASISSVNPCNAFIRRS